MLFSRHDEPAVSARGDDPGRGRELRPVLARRRAGVPAPVRRGRRHPRRLDPARGADPVRVAHVRPGCPGRAALCLPRPRALRSLPRASGSTSGSSCSTRTRRRSPQAAQRGEPSPRLRLLVAAPRPLARPPRRRRSDAEVHRRGRRVRLAGRRPAGAAARVARHLRDARQGIHGPSLFGVSRPGTYLGSSRRSRTSWISGSTRWSCCRSTSTTSRTSCSTAG